MPPFITDSLITCGIAWVERRFSGAVTARKKCPASAAEVIMSIPHRGETSCTTYSITAGTYCKKNILQSERMADLFCQTLVGYRDSGKFQLHAFVVMPNHIHLLLTVAEGLTLERVVQFIKGGFSHEAGKLAGLSGPMWQESFIDRRVRDCAECAKYMEYIHHNPVRAGLVSSAEHFRYSSSNKEFKLDELPQRLKPSFNETAVLHR
jgi:putative transposase